MARTRRLSSLESPITAAELRDPGLYPRFVNFHASSIIFYLKFVEGKVNVLLSSHQAVENNSRLEMYRKYAHLSRMLLIDSGAISPIKALLNGKGTKDDVYAWLGKQEAIVEFAWDLHRHGAPDGGVVAAMDLPVFPEMLTAMELTVAEAAAITHDNAAAFRKLELPPTWKAFYAIQGADVNDYEAHLREYEDLGILQDAREGKAWIGIGGSRTRTAQSLFDVYHFVRQHVGPDVWIHALGVGRIPELKYLIGHNLCNSADSASATQEVAYNNCPYFRIYGGMPQYLFDATQAANIMRHDALLARALNDDTDDEDDAPARQGGLFA